MSLEKLEEELWKHKQRKRQVKADERQRRQDFLDVQTAFCAELAASGYPKEMLPNENTPDSRNHVRYGRYHLRQNRIHLRHVASERVG